MTTKLEKCALFIDGANLYASQRAVDKEVDFKSLLAYYNQDYNVLRAYYYTALTTGPEHNRIHQLVDWLDYNGYTLVTKNAKKLVGDNGNARWKGNMDIELAVDMLRIAPHIDHAILFSGDGDFRCLVEAVQTMGVRVHVISNVEGKKQMASDELRRQADVYQNLDDMPSNIFR